MKDENTNLVITDSFGKEKNCKILMEFTHNNKVYLVYTEGVKTNENKLEVMAGIYSDITNQILSIETEEEWELIETMIKGNVGVESNGN